MSVHLENALEVQPEEMAAVWGLQELPPLLGESSMSSVTLENTVGSMKNPFD